MSLDEVVSRVAARYAELETSEDLLNKIKRLDNQIRFSRDIAQRRAWVLARNKLAAQYNKLTGKTAPQMPSRVPTQRL